MAHNVVNYIWACVRTFSHCIVDQQPIKKWSHLCRHNSPLHFISFERLEIFQFVSKMGEMFPRSTLAAVLMAWDSEKTMSIFWGKFMGLLNDDWVFLDKVCLSSGTPPALGGHVTLREKTTGKGRLLQCFRRLFCSQKGRITLRIQSSGRHPATPTQLICGWTPLWWNHCTFLVCLLWCCI